jgi:hypothetical protein
MSQSVLSAPQFYHGSAHKFSAGDTVDPVNGSAYFTTDVHEAGAYTMAELGSSDSAQGSVYKVEPTGKYSRDAHSGGYKSRSPLRVVGEA